MGFVGIDRGIEEHWIYQDSEYFKVWFEILLRARYSIETEKKLIEGKLVNIEYGQFIFGRVSWSDRLKISEQRLRTLLKKLIDDEMIELIQKFPKFSLYSVKNYAKYNQQSNQQPAQSYQGKQGDVNQHINSESTSSQPAANQQPTTQEQGSNKVNKVKKEIIYTAQFDEFWSLYPKPVEKVDCFATWQKIIKDGEVPEIIIQCAKNYGQYCLDEQTEPRFIKHPKTFLNKQRYQEYLTAKLKVVHGGQSNGGGNSGKYGRGNERTTPTNGFNKAELESLYVGSPVRVQQV